jgi:hypothetical protein
MLELLLLLDPDLSPKMSAMRARTSGGVVETVVGYSWRGAMRTMAAVSEYSER